MSKIDNPTPATALVYGVAGDLAQVDPGDVADAGVLNSVARADHEHPVGFAYGAVGDISAINVGDAAAAGVSANVARADHQHAFSSNFRVIGSGTTVAVNTATTLAFTGTRNAGELLYLVSWLVPLSTVRWSHDISPSGLGIVLWLERTLNANEFKLQLGNGTVTDREIEWAVLGFTP